MNIKQIWPEWETEKVLGRGSFGTVYKCFRNTENGKEYSAIKVIEIPNDNYEEWDSDIRRMSNAQKHEYYREKADSYYNEIKILESLKDTKNIVNIYDSKVVEKSENGEQEIGWQIFIRMELLSDLAVYTSDKKLSSDDVMKIAVDICNALMVCSQKKIIHRDIKPENIFVDDYGNFKLGDFGVAKQMEKSYASTFAGAMYYMAPEVIRHEKYDLRADMYSLGLVMYTLLNNNRLPFLDPDKQLLTWDEKNNAYERRCAGEKIPPIPGVDEKLMEIVLKACEFKSANRFSNIEEMKEALEGGNTKRKRITKFVKKHKIASAIAMLLVISIVSGSVFFYKNKSASTDDTTTTNSTNPVTEEPKYEIEYSGIANCIYTHNGIDYCSVYNANGDNPYATGFYSVSEKDIMLISEQECGENFVIIKDKIYYEVVSRTDSSYDERDGTATLLTNHCNSSIWMMNLDGSEKKKLLDLQESSGYPVYADEEDLYYFCDSWQRISFDDSYVMGVSFCRYNLKENESYTINESVKNECVFCDGYLYFSSIGEYGDFYKYSIENDAIEETGYSVNRFCLSGKYIYLEELYENMDEYHKTDRSDVHTKILRYNTADGTGEKLDIDFNCPTLIGSNDDMIIVRDIVNNNSQYVYYSYSEQNGIKDIDIDGYLYEYYPSIYINGRENYNYYNTVYNVDGSKEFNIKTVKGKTVKSFKINPKDYSLFGKIISIGENIAVMCVENVPAWEESNYLTILLKEKNDFDELLKPYAEDSDYMPNEESENEFLTASSQNFNKFTDFLGLSLGLGIFDEFDNSSNDALSFAFENMCGTSFCIDEVLKTTYDLNINKYVTTYRLSQNQNYPRDPLKRFPENLSYTIFDGKEFDKLLESIFNVKPNHSFALENKAYYYKGYYYILRGDSYGGDGEGPDFSINKTDLLSDGRYSFDVLYRWGNEDNYKIIANLNIIAGLKNIEGERIWSIYSIKKM